MKRDKKIDKLVKILGAEFGEIRGIKASSSFEVTVQVILANGGSVTAAARGKKALLREFVDWNEVRVASWKETGSVLEKAKVVHAGDKGIRLKKTLDAIFSETNHIDLEEVDKAEPDKAVARMNRMKDFDEAARAAVLYLVKGVKTLAPSTDMIRSAYRIGLIQKTSSSAKMRQALQKALVKKSLFPFHYAMSRLNETYCFEKMTLCDKCPALPLCKHGSSASSNRSTKENDARTGTPKKKKASKKN